MIADDIPLLGSAGKAPPGYELVLSALAEPYFPGRDDGYSQICLWGIWHRGDDPALKDPEKAAINRMQQALPTLDEESRLIRLQMACMQRCWWEFPHNLDIIIDGIGSGRVNLGGHVSCEPPWSGLIQVLRRRRGAPGQNAGRYDVAEVDFDPLYAPRQRLARAYMEILNWWIFGGDLSCLRRELPEHAELAERIYERLGPPSKLKILRAEKLRTAIGWQAFPISNGLGDAQACHQRIQIFNAAIAQEVGAADDAVTPLITPHGEIGNLCHHAFFRHVDRNIANIGAGAVVPLPGSGQERARLLEHVVNYAHALGSWLARRTPADAERIWPGGSRTLEQVYNALGSPTPLKRWLVASLHNKLYHNNMNYGRGAIDTDPQRFAIPAEALCP
ncbi:MAG: hypothetical protein FWD61_18910 [Phycisphaerales bacterium]|nr:hypothetical protein [Phycisphaerales bacterium]